MGTHEWLDVFGYILTAAVSLIAVFLAYLLNLHAKERQSAQSTLREYGERLTAVETVIELIKTTFRFKS